MRRTLAALLAVLGTLCVAGCGSGTPAHHHPSTKITSYVALGDSYTAAPYVNTTDTTSACFRSPSNYPHLLAKRLDAKLTDVSCSGAKTTNIVEGQGAEPPQLDAVTKDTDLVTLGIGANDYAMANTMLRVCPRLARRSPDGAPCKARVSPFVKAAMTQIRARVGAVIKAIRKAAPHARIIVVDYPQMIPTKNCAAWTLATGDIAFVRGLVDKLDDTLLAAAHDTGVQSLDLRAPSAGHAICSKDPWINGDQDKPGKALAMHPYENEQQAVAQLLAKKIEG